MEGLYQIFKQIFHAGDVAAGKVKHGAQAFTNNLISLIFFNKLLLQDEGRINKNIEEIEKLGGESFHEILYLIVDELLYDQYILPILQNPSPEGKEIKDFGWIGGAVDNNREQIVKTIVSILETILRRLATESASTKNNSFIEKKEIGLSSELSLSIIEAKDSSINVSMDPSKFGASIIAQILRIVKQISQQDKYISLQEGKRDEKLEKEFLQEVIKTILEKAFPEKSSDKELPYLIRNVLHYFIGWDNLVNMLAEKLLPFFSCHQELINHETFNKDQEIFIDMIVDPIAKALQNLGNDKKTLVHINGLEEKPNKFVDGMIKRLLAGDVLKKDQSIVKETFEHVKSLMKNFIAKILSDLGGGDTIDGISKVVALAADQIKNAISSINEENKEQKLKEIAQIFLGDILKEPIVDNEDIQELIDRNELSQELVLEMCAKGILEEKKTVEGKSKQQKSTYILNESYSNLDELSPHHLAELQTKLRLMKIIPKTIPLSTVYEKAILPQLTKLITELYEVLNVANEKGGEDKKLIQQVNAESLLEDIVLKGINKYLDDVAIDEENPLVEGNPILDGVIKNLLKKNGKNETTITSFLKMYIEIGVYRVIANLLRGHNQNPMDNLKGHLDNIFEKLNRLGAEINENNLDEKITKFTAALLDEMAPDHEINEFIPPMLRDGLDIKKLILPKLASIVKEIYLQKQKIEKLHRQDEEILKGKGIEVSPEILEGVVALHDKINEGLLQALEGMEIDAKNGNFQLVKEDSFLNEILQHFFGSPKVEQVRGFIKDFSPKIVTRMLANILKNGLGDYTSFIQNKVTAILKQLPHFDFDKEEKPLEKMKDLLELSNKKTSPLAQRLREFSYDRKLNFEERLSQVEMMEEGTEKQEAIKELYHMLTANTIALQIIDELITDEEVKALLPPTFQNLDMRRIIASTISPYVSDIVQNIKGLESVEKRDAEIIGQYQGLQGICDDYMNWMVDGKIVKQIKKGVMPIDKEQNSNPMAHLVNWLAKILVVDPSSSDNKEFLEKHLRRVLTHTLAHLLDKQPGRTPQEKISALMSDMILKTTTLVNKLKEVYKEKFDQPRFEELLEKHKKIIGPVDLKAMDQKQKKELWRKLLSIEPVDAFLKELMPDSMLQEIIPKFAVDNIRRIIVGQAADAMVKNRKLLIEKGLYNIVLDFTKKTTGKNVGTVREGLKKTVSSLITKAIGGFLSKIFGDKAGRIIHWTLYIVFFPVVVVGQWFLLSILDQLYLKKVDAFLKNHDLEDILKNVISRVPALLNAIHGDPFDRNEALKRAEEIFEALKDIFNWKIERKKFAKMLLSFLSPVEKGIDRNKEEFFTWLAPKINPATLFAA